MAAADRSSKDKAMSSRMKGHYENGRYVHGVVRTTMRCPVCHRVIAISTQFGHLSSHTGSARKE